MKILNFKDFKKKYDLKDDTMNESESKRIFNYKIYPKDSKKLSNKGFIKIDDGRIG